MQAVKHLRPYGQYRHTSTEHPRLNHKAHDGKIIHLDDPWWNYWTPQNGWGCNCKKYSLSQVEAEREWKKRGLTGPDEAPPIEMEKRIVGKNGSNPREVWVPGGIDPGFAYNPGKAWLEPHTVPPLQGYDAVLKERNTAWPTGVARPALPTPKSIPPSAILPAETAPMTAVEDFLDVFGATLTEGSAFTDATGSTMAITKALFEAGDGQFKWLAKPEKIDRLRYINLMAMTIIEPDEIWWAWEEDRSNIEANPEAAKRWRLKRRYLRSFEIEGSGEYGISVFEWSKIGWVGSTTFMAEPSGERARLKYFDKQRIGRLLFKK